MLEVNATPDLRKFHSSVFATVRLEKSQYPVCAPTYWEFLLLQAVVQVLFVPCTTFIIETSSSIVGSLNPLSWQYFIAPAQ